MKSFAKLNLTQQLTHNLGMAIVSGEYSDLGKLPSEAELCTQFDVSRTATREAVKMLSAKGLISSRPKQGIRVMAESHWNMFDTDVLEWILASQPSLALLKEFTQMRYAIEPEAAALAAQNPKTEAIVDLHKALIRMDNADKGLDDPLESDIEFHTGILHASNNRFITQLHEFTSTALRVSIRYTNRIKGVAVGDVEAHREVLTAIEAGDSELARQRMQGLLGEALELIESELMKLGR
ncbi:MAG: DNA-binding FadR family transcriptional regulator [Phenylobacterium sp.]|jgi:DNA-binding FadR family transcriptional regulator